MTGDNSISSSAHCTLVSVSPHPAPSPSTAVKTNDEEEHQLAIQMESYYNLFLGGNKTQKFTPIVIKLESKSIIKIEEIRIQTNDARYNTTLLLEFGMKMLRCTSRNSPD